MRENLKGGAEQGRGKGRSTYPSCPFPARSPQSLVSCPFFWRNWQPCPVCQIQPASQEPVPLPRLLRARFCHLPFLPVLGCFASPSEPPSLPCCPRSLLSPSSHPGGGSQPLTLPPVWPPLHAQCDVTEAHPMASLEWVPGRPGQRVLSFFYIYIYTSQYQSVPLSLLGRGVRCSQINCFYF